MTPELLKLFFEKTPVSMQSLDHEGRFVEVNPHWCQVLGYKKERVIGRKFEEFIIKEDLPIFRENFKRFVNTGFICDSNFHMKCYDGSIIEVGYDGQIYIDPVSGKPQTFCVFKDLTKTREAQSNVQLEMIKSEQRYRELQDNMNIGVFRVNTDGIIVYGNPAMLKLFGHNEDSLIGQSSFDFYANKEDQDRILKELYASKNKSLTTEVEFLKLNGERFWVRIHLKAIYDQLGNLVSRDGTIEDISAKKAMEINLLHAKNRAEEADNLKSTFLANMSHEIRTPMNAILGFSELMMDPAIPEKQKAEFSTLINNNGNILMNLIDDIIDISRIEAGETSIHMAPYRVYNVIEDLMVQLEQRLKSLKRSATVKNITADQFQSLLVNCDHNRYRQVISNLVDNAAKFTFDGEITVDLRIEKDGEGKEYACTSVKDSGIGIAADKLQLIFEQFRQVDESPTRKFGGTGLGLYICQKLVNLMGGKIRVSSQIGTGSEFEVLLPI